MVFGDQDATVLDTSDPESRRVFQHESPFGKALCEGVSALAREVQADEELTALINRKFSIKCTTGYAINALVDISPDEPVEMIKKLMVGSEGTFGFVSRATYNTVEDYPYKASTFILYPSFHEAGRATAALKKSGACDAIEVFDRAALHEAEKDEKMVNLVRPRRPVVLWWFHFINTSRLQERMSWLVSFSISRPFGPRCSAQVVLFEPQWGSSVASTPWPPQLLRAYVTEAKRRGLAVICDEVMCGLGRHGMTQSRK